MIPLFAVALLLARPVDAAVVAPVHTRQAPPLSARLDTILAAPALSHGIVGVVVRSLDSGRTLYERNPQTSLMPASNMKLVTGSAALALLGRDFRCTTRLVRTGEVGADGTLNGDLILVGAGDPSLSAADLARLATAAKAAGIARVAGRVLVDASIFADGPLGDGWQWDDEPFDYSPQLAGLGVDENVVTVTVTASAAADSAPTIETSGYVRVVNQAKTVAGKESKLVFDRVRGQNIVVVSGTIGMGAVVQREAVTVENPALFAAFALRAALKTAGVRLDQGDFSTTAIAPPTAALVASVDSEPLLQLLPRFLKPSDNYFGECLLRLIAAHAGRPGTAAEGAKAVRMWLTTRSIDTGGVAIADGSGLSRMDLVTPRFIADLLVEIATRFSETDRTLFVSALPVGGVDGTLRNRFKTTSASGIVRAKTGTLTGASSLSGYLTTRAGERIVFSILMNNYDRAGGSAAARAAQDAIVLALMEMPKGR